ncbi:LPXTG cell wall anchor domain-containing protein [Herbiconiux sp. CPCC 205763]|uniref:LPXTG cell wall anchor domain-containing protein n=1 Tax=Herbiconiux aconitum TaxID=2970913 RepID=A0ABT2GU92_9MICO|nr:LPXTG cell wall anchor domain-containing protein [Herbiconiux aconitum]MCS5719780.1 LPXTG cell wall anchor domain-containing protein [Herbiconiux aconitum]
MICDQLPNTGFSPQLWMIAIGALVCVFVGAVVLARRRRLGVAAALILVVALGATAVGLPAQPAQASTAGCTSAPASVTVVQTSVMEGLAPGIAPTAIAGLVENTGTARIHVVAVDVEITTISTVPGSATGACDPSDYVLLDPRMPVDRSLDAGRSTPFAGASIGFSNKVTRQDACQNAIVNLLYTVQAVEN